MAIDVLNEWASESPAGGAGLAPAKLGATDAKHHDVPHPTPSASEHGGDIDGDDVTAAEDAATSPASSASPSLHRPVKRLVDLDDAALLLVAHYCDVPTSCRLMRSCRSLARSLRGARGTDLDSLMDADIENYFWKSRATFLSALGSHATAPPPLTDAIPTYQAMCRVHDEWHRVPLPVRPLSWSGHTAPCLRGGLPPVEGNVIPSIVLGHRGNDAAISGNPGSNRVFRTNGAFGNAFRIAGGHAFYLWQNGLWVVDIDEQRDSYKKIIKSVPKKLGWYFGPAAFGLTEPGNPNIVLISGNPEEPDVEIWSGRKMTKSRTLRMPSVPVAVCMHGETLAAYFNDENAIQVWHVPPLPADGANGRTMARKPGAGWRLPEPIDPPRHLFDMRGTSRGVSNFCVAMNDTMAAYLGRSPTGGSGLAVYVRFLANNRLHGMIPALHETRPASEVRMAMTDYHLAVLIGQQRGIAILQIYEIKSLEMLYSMDVPVSTDYKLSGLQVSQDKRWIFFGKELNVIEDPAVVAVGAPMTPEAGLGAADLPSNLLGFSMEERRWERWSGKKGLGFWLAYREITRQSNRETHEDKMVWRTLA
ncbi:hypothetical protein CXG81DRAFT_19114 [Caulochytrium protostelioides]|uniref:Uncharacterized protein n=1 Tax=Caulochytrium protostelioides TaxID=1555241 RepID=A0A4P9WXZ4_9FUNG|nr:hypothetical protein CAUPRSCDRAFT_10940 [Caulochytrium protostelioides]RKP01016.1 hypothetical protein CXG81DRAFT_19114 [Caulochytrium protostelioides]|eukprot:RKP01016.1 hypothetical protein CXG81DRAFT_19114 [Caulochytrium protostelioides]